MRARFFVLGRANSISRNYNQHDSQKWTEQWQTKMLDMIKIWESLPGPNPHKELKAYLGNAEITRKSLFQETDTAIGFLIPNSLENRMYLCI